jgi:hypothetical protein
MASNTPTLKWSVRITQIPTTIDKSELAKELRLPPSRINILKTKPNKTPGAWINDFNNEYEAKEFVRQWSGAKIHGQSINCIARPPRNESQTTTTFGDIPESDREPSNVPETKLTYHRDVSTARPDGKHMEKLPDSSNDSNTSFSMRFSDPFVSEAPSMESSIENKPTEDGCSMCHEKRNECRCRHQRCHNYESVHTETETTASSASSLPQPRPRCVVEVARSRRKAHCTPLIRLNRVGTHQNRA